MTIHLSHYPINCSPFIGPRIHITFVEEIIIPFGRTSPSHLFGAIGPTRLGKPAWIRSHIQDRGYRGIDRNTRDTNHRYLPPPYMTEVARVGYGSRKIRTPDIASPSTANPEKAGIFRAV
jgi:hypothetical protein